MRPSQRKRLTQHLQQEQSLSYTEEKSLQLHTRNHRNNHIVSKDPSHIGKHVPKYYPRKKDEYLSILDGGNQEIKDTREDYNSRNPPPQASRMTLRRGGWSREEERYHRSKQEMDEQLQAYNKRGEKTMRSKEEIRKYDKQSTKSNSNEMILKDALFALQEIDLSYSESKPNYNFKKDKNTQQSFSHKQETIKKENDDDSLQWIKPQKPKNEIKRQEKRKEVAIERKKEETKRQVPSKKQQQKPQKIEIKPQKSEQLQKRQERGSQQIDDFVKFQQLSSESSMNQAFNNISKQSSSQSSLWVQQKILQQLSASLSKHSDQFSDSNNESFISNIHDSTQQISQNSQFSQAKEDPQKVETILSQIDNSDNFQDKDIIVEINMLKNIQEMIIKEVYVHRLKTSLNLALSLDGIIVKRSIVDVQKLIQYISFYKIQLIHPHTSPNDPFLSTFQFCRLKVPAIEGKGSSAQSCFIKKGKKRQQQNTQETIAAVGLLRVVRVEVRCMNCGKSSDVPVIQNTNEATLSCRNCGEQMIAKIQRIAFANQ